MGRGVFGVGNIEQQNNRYALYKASQSRTDDAELERDLEMERRKAVSHQEALKEREKEYQKLKVCSRYCCFLAYKGSIPVSRNWTRSNAKHC